MTTATESLAGRLTELEDERDREHQKARDKKREASAWNDQTEALRGEFTAHRHAYPEEYDKRNRPIESTKAAKLQEKVRKRMAETNPYDAEVNAAVRDFHRSGNLANQFRLSNWDAIVAEFPPDVEDITIRALAAFEMLAGAMGDYELLEERTRDFILDTPGLNGRALTSDPRVAEWAKLAAAALEEPLTRPRLTEKGRYRLDQIRQAEADNG